MGRALIALRGRAVVGVLTASLLTVVGAGCGGSSPSTASHSTTSHSPTSALALDAYLVHGNEETGLRPIGAPATDPTPADWTAQTPNSQAETARLQREGFHAVVSVHTGSAHAQGVSWVMELGSATDAGREQRAELLSFSQVPGRVGHFTVQGVPTAEGFTYPGPNPQDANALFREGRCLLLVGDQESGADYRAPVIAAVRAIWARTNAQTGPCTA